MSSQIKRKPVPRSAQMDTKQELTSKANLVEESSREESPPKYHELDIADSPLVEGEARSGWDDQLANLELETDEAGGLANPTDDSLAETTQGAEAEQEGRKSSKLKYAFGEIKYFAGGLIARPFEATKHYTILRHSHGFVFYQGPTTSVAITVFSNQSLPPDRTLWLQKRGFSGKTGMKIGTLGSRGAWIDVTPTIDGEPDLLPANDERAWQRDITKFMKKAKETKNLSSHKPYETNVIRIPHVAEDGYFRIVLCAGRKVLCPSPIFRYASSTLDPSVLRGASLKTLPLELGVMIGSTVARTTADTATAGALQPAVSTVQNAVEPYQYGGTTQWAATTAYESSGAAEQVDSAVEDLDQQYDEKRELAASSAIEEGTSALGMIGEEGGPGTPYPIRFSARFESAAQDEKQSTPVLSSTLTRVPRDVLLRLSGTYFGWASISKPRAAGGESLDDVFETWIKALVVVAPCRQTKLAVVENKTVNVHILKDLTQATISNASISLMVMGCIRSGITSPASSPTSESPRVMLQDDIILTRRSLDRPAWQPDPVLERIKSASSERSFTERVADARQAGQNQIDRIPIHRLGVRTDSMGVKDQLIGTGGICIRRQQ